MATGSEGGVPVGGRPCCLSAFCRMMNSDAINELLRGPTSQSLPMLTIISCFLDSAATAGFGNSSRRLASLYVSVRYRLVQ